MVVKAFLVRTFIVVNSFDFADGCRRLQVYFRGIRVSMIRIASQKIYSKWNRCLKLEIYSK